MSRAVEAAIRKQAQVTATAIAGNEQRIGEILVAQGSITEADIDAILQHAERKGMLFGEAGIALKLFTKKELDTALAKQFRFPYVQPSRGSFSKELVVAYKPFSKAAERFRNVRASLMLDGYQRDKKLLAIVSPNKKDGRSYIAANLAVAFAQMGKRTVLVDGNLKEPRLHDIFQIDLSRGVTSLLSGYKSGTDVGEAIPEIPNLHVITAGAAAPNPEELIASDAFGQLILDLRKQYDIVLIDTPPGGGGSAADWIAARAGNVLLVNRRDKTRLADARDFADRMRSRGAVVGAILNTR
jgi:chain length determinant protein tyrosine kinase EpsG